MKDAVTIILGSFVCHNNYFNKTQNKSKSSILRRIGRRWGRDPSWKYNPKKANPWERAKTKKKLKERKRKEQRDDAKIPSMTVASSHQIGTGCIDRRPKPKPKLNCRKKKTIPSLAECSPNTLLNQLEGGISSIATPERKSVRRRLQKLLEQTPATPPPTNNIASPVARTATKNFTNKMEQVCTPTREEMFHAVKQSVRKKQRPNLTLPKNPSPDDPIDPHAFRHYHPKLGISSLRPFNTEPCADNANKPKYIVEKAAYRAERRAIEKNKESILAAGDADQISLALKGVLEDPTIKPYYHRVLAERNSEAAKIGMEAVAGMRKLVDIVAASRDDGGKSRQCRSLLQTMVMTMLNNDSTRGTKSAIRRQILAGLSEGAAWRLLEKAGEKRRRFEESDVREYRAVEEEEDRLKFPEQELEDLQGFMCDNLYTRFSPNEHDTIRKRDINGDWIKDGLTEDGKQKYLMIRRVFITVGLRELHLLMMKDKKDGGYENAWQEKPDGSRIARFSKNSLRHYWPNWLKEMSDAEKVICGCSTCLDTDDVVEAYNGKRRKLIARTEVELDEMEETTVAQKQDKLELANDLENYKKEILNDDGTHKHERGWSASEQFGCGRRVRICAGHYPDDCPNDCQEVKDLAHFTCQSGRCEDCISMDYMAPKFEMDRVSDDEMFTYTLFTPHTRCNLHGGNFLERYDSKPKVRCTICEKLSEADRKKRKAKIVRKKFRTKHTVRFKKFIEKGGTFSQHLKKMFAHKHKVILLGKDHKKRHRLRHARMLASIVKIERDFAERLKIAADKEQQFQYFSNDTSVGMEGITVYLKPQGSAEYEKQFYSILTTEKEQDGRIVYANTKIVIEHIKRELKNGTDVGGITFSKGLKEILDDSDGCMEQYKCATALYMLHKLANEEDIIYDRGIDAGGHGKKDIDGYNGGDKGAISSELRGNVIYQEEARVEKKRSYLLCDMIDGKRVDAADICKEILKNPERGKSVPANKPRTEKTRSDLSLSKRVYEVRKEGDAKWGGLKMKAMGFDTTEKGNGLKEMYNFRFERSLREKFAYCRFPCSCTGCYDRLQLPTPEERYGGARDTCYLWPIMKSFDIDGNPTGKGYNDWGMGWFETRNDCSLDQFHGSKADTMRVVGKTYSSEVSQGNFGAYCIANHPTYPYYIVEWIGEPWVAEKSEVITIGEEEFTVHEGDYLCRGIWLEKLEGARNWHTTTSTFQECVVRLETVLNANIEMRPVTKNNSLPKRLQRKSVAVAKDRGAWRMSDDDHGFLIEESRHREAGFEYNEELAMDARQQEEEARIWQSEKYTKYSSADESDDGEEALI